MHLTLCQLHIYQYITYFGTYIYIILMMSFDEQNLPISVQLNLSIFPLLSVTHYLLFYFHHLCVLLYFEVHLKRAHIHFSFSLNIIILIIDMKHLALQLMQLSTQLHRYIDHSLYYVLLFCFTPSVWFCLVSLLCFLFIYLFFASLFFKVIFLNYFFLALVHWLHMSFNA